LPKGHSNVGGAWPRNNWSDTLFLRSFNNNNGVFIGGGQIGFNYQIGKFVVGAEWDFDGAGNSGHGAAVSIPTGANIVVTSNNHFISTVAGRFGYTVDRLDHVLFYGKAARAGSATTT
jgi:outer membrane immunogenic protein